jgi:malate synthase
MWPWPIRRSGFGNGAVAIHNLIEDAATAEIRAQVWQQIKNGTVLADTGEKVTKDLVARTLDEEVERLWTEVSEDAFERHYLPAKELISSLVLDDDFTDFLTLPAYEQVV